MDRVLAVIAILVIVWLVLIVALIAFGRRALAREIATLVPNLTRLFTSLVRDPRVPLRTNVVHVATETTTKVSFSLLCPDHKTGIKNKRWCPVGEHEVASTVKGYEYEKGQYVIFDDDDLEKLPLNSSRSIDIAGFVQQDELPGELYYQNAYYLEPDKAAQKPYTLLVKTPSTTT